MSTKGLTFSKDLTRDKLDDIVAVNLDLIDTLILGIEQLRSQNQRVRALRAGQMPLTARAQANSPVVATDEAA